MMAKEVFDRRVIQGSVEQMFPVNMGLYDLFFGGKEVEPVDTEYVEIDVYKGSRRISKYSKRGHRGSQVENVGYKTVTHKPPLMSPEKTTRAAELFKKEFGKSVYDDSGSSARAYAKLGKDFAELKEMCERTKLTQVSDALSTGTITIVEDGETRVIDFDMPASHKIILSGGDLWSDTTNSDPIADIKAWKRLASQDSGVVCDAMVFGNDVVDAFVAHPKVQAYMDKRRMNLGEVNMTTLENGLVQIATNIHGVTIYSYDELIRDEATQLNVPVVADDKVLFGATGAKVSVHFAGIEVTEDEIVYVDAAQEYSEVYTDKAEKAMKARYQTAPLCALSQADAFGSATVL